MRVTPTNFSPSCSACAAVASPSRPPPYSGKGSLNTIAAILKHSIAAAWKKRLAAVTRVTARFMAHYFIKDSETLPHTWNNPFERLSVEALFRMSHWP
jgi:hypothetical protein